MIAAPAAFSNFEAPAIGLHNDVDEHAYRAWDAVNQSTLWTFRRSAAHARHAFLHPSSSAQTDLGSAIHCICLEPAALETRYAVRPPGIDRRTKEGKLAWAAFEAESAGKTILGERDDFDSLASIRDAVMEHELAAALLVSAPGYTEVSAVWSDPALGVLCKGRMDRIVEYGGWTWVVDLKSTTDASPQGFARSVVQYGYHVQHPFYLDGLDALAPRDRRFAFVAVEKQPPYAIGVYELDMMFVEAGRDEYRRYLTQWHNCQVNGLWPGYPAEIALLEAPSWFEKRLSRTGGF